MTYTKTLLLFAPDMRENSQTFVRSHIKNLPFNVIAYQGKKWDISDQNGNWVFPGIRWIGKVLEQLFPGINKYLYSLMLAAFMRLKNADYIMAEFGVTATWLLQSCKLAKLPLFVIFHGYDAYVNAVLAKNIKQYQQVFEYTSGMLAVSNAMKVKLISIGAPENRLHWSPCGVDPDAFVATDPGKNSPIFLAVGRFVEKKAPYLTILAFDKALKKIPNLELRLIGDGPLLGPCKRIVDALNIGSSVKFLGAQEHCVVAGEMRTARAFIQHSLVAENGDSEGTPVAVIEAQMTGLPVISTNHAGIPEVVIDGETGFLVDECDIDNMAVAIIKLAHDAQLASRLGKNGYERVSNLFTIRHHTQMITKMITDIG